MGQYLIGTAKTMTATDTELNKRLQVYRWLIDILFRAGYPTILRGYVIAQVLHETGNLTSRLATTGTNNITGIKYTKNSPYQSGKSGAYATYKTYEDWAKDLKRILLFKPGTPYNATTITDYVNRLKLNRYFEDSAANYLKGLNNWAIKNNQAINWSKGVHKDMANSPTQQVVNTEGWTAADDKAVAKQEKPNFWDVEKWSTSNKIFAGMGALAALAILTRR